MKYLPQLLKELAQHSRCKRHKWIYDKQGRYCIKCRNRQYDFNKFKKGEHDGK